MLFGPFVYDEKIVLAGPLVRKDVDILKAEGFDLIVSNRPDGEAEKQVTAERMRGVIEASGMRFVHIPFKGSQMSVSDVEAYAAAIAPARKVLAMCATGTRCAMISAAADVRSGMLLEKAIAKAKAAGFDLAAMDGFIGSFAKQAA